MEHLRGLRRYTLFETVAETYTNAAGDRMEIIDTTEGFEVQGFRSVDLPSGSYTLQNVRRDDGETFWIALHDDRQGTLAHVRTRSQDGVITKVFRYADTPAAGAGGFDTAEDLLASLGDPSVLAARTAEYERRADAADEARDDAIVSGNPVWSKPVYVAACRAGGVPALGDEEIIAAAPELQAGGHWLNDFTVTEVLFVRLAIHRLMDMRGERVGFDAVAIAAADSAAGAGPYSREQYERACAAACAQALTDEQAATLANAALNAPLQVAPGAVVYARPGEGAVDVTLAMRRMGGLQAERRAEQSGAAGVEAEGGDGDDAR